MTYDERERCQYVLCRNRTIGSRRARYLHHVSDAASKRVQSTANLKWTSNTISSQSPQSVLHSSSRPLQRSLSSIIDPCTESPTAKGIGKSPRTDVLFATGISTTHHARYIRLLLNQLQDYPHRLFSSYGIQ